MKLYKGPGMEGLTIYKLVSFIFLVGAAVHLYQQYKQNQLLTEIRDLLKESHEQQSSRPKFQVH